MSSSIPVDFTGKSLITNPLNIIDVIKQAESMFVNEHGDVMKGDLNLNMHRLNGIPEPTLDDDATNMKFVNDMINVIEKNIKKSIEDNHEKIKNNIHKVLSMKIDDYAIIKSKASLKFWVSAHYPHGLSKSSGEFRNLVTDEPLYIKGDPYIYYEEHPAMYFPKNSRIVSDFSFGNEYTFFLIAKKYYDEGRLFTSSYGNSCMGWWSKYHEMLSIDGNLSGNRNISDNKIHLCILRSTFNESANNCEIVFWNGSSIIRSLLYEGSYSWKEIVIGQPIMYSEESLKGYVYECLCYDKPLTDPEINYLKKTFRKYYNYE